MGRLILSACVGAVVRDDRTHCFVSIEGNLPFGMVSVEGVEMSGHFLLNPLRNDRCVTAVVAPPVFADEELSLSIPAGAISWAGGECPAMVIPCVNNSTLERPSR